MSLLKRLGFYLIGLAIGLIFLAFFLNRKRAQFCYLPNCRVLKELRTQPLKIEDPVLHALNNQNLDSTAVYRFLTEGDVRFRDSDTKAKPCPVYVIEAQTTKGEARLTVQNCDSLTIATAWEPLED